MNEISTNTIINDDLQKQLRGTLEERIELDETKTFKTLKTFYQACTNTGKVIKYATF